MEFQARENARGNPCRSPFLLAALLVFLALIARASSVKLKNGVTYDDVTIMDTTDTQIVLRTKYGELPLPLSTVSTIDGVPVVAPTPRPPPAGALGAVGALGGQATPSQTGFGVSPGTPAPGASATATPPPETTASPSPGGDFGALSSGPPYVHDWRMDALLAICGAAALLWLATLVFTQEALRESGSARIWWNAVTLLLPGAGFLLFKMFARLSPAPGRGSILHAPVDPKLMEQEERRRKKTGHDAPEVSGSDTAQHILEAAVAARTSDVHLDPQEDGYRVRFRVDGILEERTVLDKKTGIRVVSALKSMGSIDVSEKRKAQDGRLRIRIGNRDVDMRLATANSIFGEKIVIRLLDRQVGIFGLAELGMSQEMVDRFNQAIHSHSGMILATGPTGAGKTSTLYAALTQLDRKQLNVMTIEDPAEYELDGATQIPVDERAGVTYESGLRSILRQDPDVILVGEMRDAEAAKIAIRAALTGTLVFSSLHTRDTINALMRLGEMGVEPARMASSLQMLTAQRLVRILCTACREPYACAAEELHDIGIEMPAGETIYRAKGCEACSHTGYRGRTGIFELLVLDDEIRQAIGAQAGEAELLELARARGFRGYREAGADRILEGVTSVSEVLQAG